MPGGSNPQFRIFMGRHVLALSILITVVVVLSQACGQFEVESLSSVGARPLDVEASAQLMSLATQTETVDTYTVSNIIRDSSTAMTAHAEFQVTTSNIPVPANSGFVYSITEDRAEILSDTVVMTGGIPANTTITVSNTKHFDFKAGRFYRIMIKGKQYGGDFYIPPYDCMTFTLVEKNPISSIGSVHTIQLKMDFTCSLWLQNVFDASAEIIAPDGAKTIVSTSMTLNGQFGPGAPVVIDLNPTYTASLPGTYRVLTNSPKGQLTYGFNITAAATPTPTPGPTPTPAPGPTCSTGEAYFDSRSTERSYNSDGSIAGEVGNVTLLVRGTAGNQVVYGSTTFATNQKFDSKNWPLGRTCFPSTYRDPVTNQVCPATAATTPCFTVTGQPPPTPTPAPTRTPTPTPTPTPGSDDTCIIDSVIYGINPNYNGGLGILKTGRNSFFVPHKNTVLCGSRGVTEANAVTPSLCSSAKAIGTPVENRVKISLKDSISGLYTVVNSSLVIKCPIATPSPTPTPTPAPGPTCSTGEAYFDSRSTERSYNSDGSIAGEVGNVTLLVRGTAGNQVVYGSTTFATNQKFDSKNWPLGRTCFPSTYRDPVTNQVCPATAATTPCFTVTGQPPPTPTPTPTPAPTRTPTPTPTPAPTYSPQASLSPTRIDRQIVDGSIRDSSESVQLTITGSLPPNAIIRLGALPVSSGILSPRNWNEGTVCLEITDPATNKVYRSAGACLTIAVTLRWTSCQGAADASFSPSSITRTVDRSGNPINEDGNVTLGVVGTQNQVVFYGGQTFASGQRFDSKNWPKGTTCFPSSYNDPVSGRSCPTGQTTPCFTVN